MIFNCSTVRLGLNLKFNSIVLLNINCHIALITCVKGLNIFPKKHFKNYDFNNTFSISSSFNILYCPFFSVSSSINPPIEIRFRYIT